MLDKLISNAIDFNLEGRPITVSVENKNETLVLSVSNEGPPLPEDIQYNLFDSMVSVRDKSGTTPHLGLGLYIVRMISDFHKGKVLAQNLENTLDNTLNYKKGVCISVEFPYNK